MGPFVDLLHGFATALTPAHLMMCFVGVLLGQIVGILPGIGPSAAIALLLPLTFGADPTAAIIMFAGIYYGAQYGGTLTSVLISVPGESSTVMTSIDGYQMALQGRAGSALGIAAIGSFIAGTVGTLGLMLVAPPLARAALAFGPPEYFALVVLGLTALAAVGGSVLKGLAAGVAGLLLATIGVDPQTGVSRFAFGQLWLLDGIEFIVLTVALFGVGEVIASCATAAMRPVAEVKSVLPSREEWRASRMPIVRGSLIGFLVGVLPATGATIASFIAYIVEKKVAKDPSRFGKGAIEGVAGPEASNNAAAAGAMVPMLSLGVPGSGTTAIILGALIMFGLRPGPEMFEKNADLVWAVIASMYVGNLLLLVMNLPLAGLFAQLLRNPLQVALSAHPGALHRRRVLAGKQHPGLLAAGRLRGARLADEAIRLASGSNGAWAGPWAALRKRAPSVAHAVAWQQPDFSHAPNLWRPDRACCDCRAAPCAASPRRSAS